MNYHNHPLRPLLLKRAIFFIICLWVFPVQSNNLPTLGDPSIRHFSDQQETMLGKAFYTSLRENLSFIDDLQISHYLNTLSHKLVSHSDAAGSHFRFFMIESNAINAFAGPHGYVGINSGLVLEAQNESQLAGVLAHEISHVSQRHIARAYAQSGTQAAASFATILAAILISTQDPEAGQATLLAGIAGAQQSAINFTRQNEYEADRIGIELLANSGINPQGMVDFFNTLLARGDGFDIEYLRTHPLNENRVAEAKNRLKSKHINLPNNSVDFNFCKARLEVLSSNHPEAFITKNDDNDEVLRYKKAIAFIKINQAKDALKLLKPLTKKNTHPWIKLAYAEALNQNEQLDLATSTLGSLALHYPDYLPVTLAYAENLLAGKQSQLSISILLRQLQTDDSAIVHKMLAQSYYINGQVSAALESTGDQYERDGYIELAIQQYETALQQPSLNASSKKRLTTKKESLTAINRE